MVPSSLKRSCGTKFLQLVCQLALCCCLESMICSAASSSLQDAIAGARAVVKGPAMKVLSKPAGPFDQPCPEVSAPNGPQGPCLQAPCPWQPPLRPRRADWPL